MSFKKRFMDHLEEHGKIPKGYAHGGIVYRHDYHMDKMHEQEMESHFRTAQPDDEFDPEEADGYADGGIVEGPSMAPEAVQKAFAAAISRRKKRI